MKQLFLPIICITFTTIVLKYLIKLRHKKRHKILEEDLNAQYYHQCNFINMKQFNCRPHLLEVKECGDFCSLVYEKEIRSLIASAKISVCICMYIISLKEVIFALIRASRRGVEVRVITDKVMLKTDVMQRNFAKLKNLGIPYKTQPSEQCIMHHKFCLIDKENPELAKLLFGSLNFTTQALTKNFESFIITNNHNILDRFGEEFESLWAEF